ncbi:3-hydroxyacyl-CoA dehydrogenase NAD-binding domain-containing protein [Alphaproteobacteria bacterium]|nr:3-hydroxyacyl-CoA dehydrogenase NAD-binding domain-containing protein [Alphaproteobacteria bacterium]
MIPVKYKILDEIGVIEISNPPVNAISAAVRIGLLDTLEKLSSNEKIKAIVITAPERTFLAGADIKEFGKKVDAPILGKICDKIESLNKIVVASLHGTPLGGGLEVAMSAHYRIAASNTKVGLPEVLLGILPGAGGTQRLPRLCGVDMALDMMLTGKHVPAKEALSAGIIDEIADNKNTVDNGIEYAKKLIEDGFKPRPASQLQNKISDKKEIDELILKFKDIASKKYKNLFSPHAIIRSVEEGIKLNFAEAISNERKLFEECIESPQRQGLIHSFFAERANTKIPELKDGTPIELKKIGIIGGGTMGTGISMAAMNAGFDVIMVEQNDDAIQKAKAKINSTYDRSVKLNRISTEQKQQFMDLFSATTDFSDLKDRDLIIEAVFENMDVKKEVFVKLNQICSKECILASNTSYLNVNEIASVVDDPTRVIGLHFFSPANIMKLLEVVVAEKTSKDTVATAFNLAKKMKKVPVRSGVCDGFIGNRILSKYLIGTYHMVEDGASPFHVDKVIREFGCAMGIFQVIDLAGGDIGWATRKRKAPFRHKDDRYVEIPDRVCERGWFGQKTSKGYYLYGEDVPFLTPNPEIEMICEQERERVGITPKKFDDTEILDKYIAAMVYEGTKILSEKIALKPSDIDVVFTNGYGFPKWRGGPMKYADMIGLDKILKNIQKYSEENPRFWAPPKLLEDLVKQNKNFDSLN